MLLLNGSSGGNLVRIVENDADIADLADAGLSTEAGQTCFNSRVAEQTLLRPACLPIEVDLFVWTAGNTVAPATALLLVHQYDTVLISLVESAGRARGHTSRVQTVFTETWKIKHEDLFKLEVNLVIQVFKIHITRAGGAHPGKIILPVGAPLQPHGLAGNQGLWSGCRLMFFGRAGDQFAIIIGPGLVVLVDTRKIRVVKNLQQFSRPTAGAKTELSPHLPTAFVKGLVLPLLRIANSRLGLDIVKPDVLGATPVGPDVLAGNAAGVAAETFVQIQDHGDLCFNLHTSPPFLPFGPRSPHRAEHQLVRNS